MFYTSFRSSKPYDHVPRMLDTLRRMGFALHSIVLETPQPDSSVIEVIYQPRGHLDPATFVERLKGMPGVDDVADGPIRLRNGPAFTPVSRFGSAVEERAGLA